MCFIHTSQNTGASRSTLPYPLVALGLREVRGQPEFGHKGEGLAHGEVRKEAVVLAHVRDALLYQLSRVGATVDQNLAGCHAAALVATRDDVQQRGFAAACTGATTRISVRSSGNAADQSDQNVFAPVLEALRWLPVSRRRDFLEKKSGCRSMNHCMVRVPKP